MTINNGEQVINLAKALGAMAKEADMICVVRCKDCKHWEREGTKGICNDLYGYGRYWKPDDYCSYGERGDADET